MKYPPEYYPTDPWYSDRTCRCLQTGLDGTRNHSRDLVVLQGANADTVFEEGLYLIEKVGGLSDGRRAWSCWNHLPRYFIRGEWKLVKMDGQLKAGNSADG